MKKLAILSVGAALLLYVVPAFAKVERVNGPWDLSGTCEISYTGINIAPGPYVHTYNITAMDLTTGVFSGTGQYNPNPAYTENINGNVAGSNISFHVLYTGLNPGYFVDAIGTIADGGSLSGTALSSTGQTFSFVSTSSCGTRFEGNHGQYVSSQDNKQEAAQSRIGMPIQSKGHTK